MRLYLNSIQGRPLQQHQRIIVDNRKMRRAIISIALGFFCASAKPASLRLRRGDLEQGLRRNLRQEGDEWYLPESQDDVDTLKSIPRTYLFGAGDSSDWGKLDDNSSGLPTLIEVEALRLGEWIIQVSAGSLHSMVVTSKGRILTAGSLREEGRGLGRDSSNTKFEAVTEVYPLNEDDTEYSMSSETYTFTKVVGSQHFSFALDHNGDVWSTGVNSHGQLCLGDTTSRDRFHQVQIPESDKDTEQRSFSSKARIVDIALGEKHTLLLREDGVLWGCGWNQFGQILPIKGDNVLSPSKIMIDAPDNNDETSATDDRPINHEVVTQIAAGRGQSYFLTESGHIYASGTNFHGQLCLGHKNEMSLPSLVAGVDKYLSEGSDFSLLDEGVKVKHIAAGRSSLYVLLSDGQMLSCGKNIHGQLGLGVVDRDVDTPTVMDVAKATRVFSSSSSFGAFFVNEDATIYRVGFGFGARENWRPTPVACPDGGLGRDISRKRPHSLLSPG